MLKTLIYRVASQKMSLGEASWFSRAGGNDIFSLKLFKLLQSLWNHQKSKVYRIPDRYRAAEVFLTPTDLWDRWFSIFCVFLRDFGGFWYISVSISALILPWKWYGKLKIIYPQARMELKKLLQLYIDQEFDVLSISDSFRGIRKVLKALEKIYHFFPLVRIFLVK